MDVGVWLRGLSLDQYEQAFRDNDVDAEVLPELAEADLEKLGVASLGHRKRLLKAIAALRADAASSLVPPTAPREVAEEHARGRPTTRAERRQLTVMFVDLVGSTALSARVDPEEMREVLRAYQNAVTGEIARVDGHVAKLMGDGVLAYFGWPRAHEDEEERAVRAGLAIAEAVARLAAPAGDPLACRVGIATGLVVVGDLVGEGAAQEEAVVGETPNLAARLQAIAEPGAIVVADGTRRLLGELFDLRPLGATCLKGFATPLVAFQVLGERPAGSRFEAHQSGRLSPMVGRDQELALLVERWREAATGEGQAVLLVGEAGIGKSRLVRAVLDVVAGEECTELRCQCSPHHTGTALWPVARQLDFAARFGPADDDVAKLGKLEVLLRQAAEDIGEAVPVLARLLGIDPGDRYPALDLTPQQQRARTLAVLVDQLLGLARRQPVLMVLEDAHWSDPTTLELMMLALDRIAGARVLMLLTSRPDGQPALAGHPHVTRLTLNRLGRGPTEAIVARLATDRVLPPAVLGEIVARTDGVPLFVEELTKAVLEAGADGAAVPPSLHASLMARLDRVPEVKQVAQVAACIGREFDYPLLAAISPVLEPELKAALDRLAAAELVFARGDPPDASYTFKHALVRDAAYESLLKAERQKLHARIGDVLERSFPDATGAEPELLAHHFAEAGLPDKAAIYGLEAGRAAFRRSAVTEAVVHLRRALGLLTRMPEDDDRRRLELDLQIALGHALIAAKGYGVPGVRDAFARARELATAADTALHVSMLSGIGAYHFMRAESRAALRVGRAILRLSRRGDDPAAYVEGQRRIGGAFHQLGRLVPAQRHFERGLARFAPAQEPVREPAFTVEPYSTLLAHLFPNLLLLGYPDRARTRRLEAIELARRAAHPLTLAQHLHLAALSAFVLRDRPGLRAWVDEFVALTAEHTLAHFMQWARIWRGWLAAEGGGGQASLTQVQEALSAAQATGARYWSPFYTALLADAHRRAGDTDRALEVLGTALEQVEQTDERVYEAELHRLKGAVLLSRVPPSTGEAEGCFRRALAVAQTQKARLWELRAATSLARLWQAQGKRREARNLLEPVYAWFTEGFDTPDLEEAMALLDELR